MSMKLHINNVCWLAYSELRLISTIWHLLSVDSTRALVSAFFLSRLDYCNLLLSGCPKHLLEKLQKVLKAHKWDHVSPLLRTLHWLPIQTPIECKLLTLCHSFFSDTAPVYLSDLLYVYSPLRQLRSSSDRRTLCISHIKTKTFLDIAHFPMPLLLSGILCLVKLDTFSQPLHLELFWRLVCSNSTSAS